MSVRRGGRGGFLLAEALVTLALSAIILVGLASLIGLLIRAGDRAAAAAERQEVSSRLVATLRRDLAAATPVRWAGRENAAFVFDGLPDRLVFAVTGRGGVGAVAWEAEPVDGGTRLLRAEFSLPASAENIGAVAVPDAVEVFRGAAPVAFRYVGRASPGAEETVAPAWPSGESHPTGVIVDIGEAELRVAFAVTAEPGCAARDTPCSLRGAGAAPAAGDDAAGDE